MSRPRPKPMKRRKPPPLLLPSEQEAFGQAKAAGSAYRGMPNGGIMIVAEDEMVEFSENAASVYAAWRRDHPASMDGMFAVDRLPRLTLADVPGDGPREALAAMLAHPELPPFGPPNPFDGIHLQVAAPDATAWVTRDATGLVDDMVASANRLLGEGSDE